MNKEEIIIIDNLHAKANKDIKNKNLDEYMSVFSDDLRYTQFNGKTINKQRLAQDQKKHWSRILKTESKYERLNYQLEGGLFIENLNQEVTVWIRLFVFFRKKWTYNRNGKYVWKKVNGLWKICQIEIMKEKIS